MSPLWVMQVEGPGAIAPGPRVTGLNTIYRPEGRLALSAPPTFRVRCEDRISVTEDHLSVEGTTVSAQARVAAGGGRSNGVQPSLSSASVIPIHMYLYSRAELGPQRALQAPRSFASDGRSRQRLVWSALSTPRRLAGRREYV